MDGSGSGHYYGPDPKYFTPLFDPFLAIVMLNIMCVQVSKKKLQKQKMAASRSEGGM